MTNLVANGVVEITGPVSTMHVCVLTIGVASIVNIHHPVHLPLSPVDPTSRFNIQDKTLHVAIGELMDLWSRVSLDWPTRVTVGFCIP